MELYRQGDNLDSDSRHIQHSLTPYLPDLQIYEQGGVNFQWGCQVPCVVVLPA